MTFKGTYGVHLEKIALIPLTFYLTQLLVDIAAAKFADKIGYRLCVIASQVLSSAGLLSLTILPDVLLDPLTGILISVVLYAIGSGLIEVLLSPIVEACPFENKDGIMSLLHSFYCWGAVSVILGSTLFFAIFGIEHWKIMTMLWALIPLYNAINFISCPIEKLVEELRANGTLQLIGEDVDEDYLNELKQVTVDKDMVKANADKLKIIDTPLHGTGKMLYDRAFRQGGFDNVIPVPSQSIIDPEFPTTIKPNPEYRDVFEP